MSTRKKPWRRNYRRELDAVTQPGSLHPVGSADYVRIFPAEGKQATHMVRPGMDYTICGYDTSGDDMVHRKPPVFLRCQRRVTCSDCNAIIEAVKDHLNPPNAPHEPPRRKQT